MTDEITRRDWIKVVGTISIVRNDGEACLFKSKPMLRQHPSGNPRHEIAPAGLQVLPCSDIERGRKWKRPKWR